MSAETTSKAGHAASLVATMAMVLVLIGTVVPQTPARAQTPRDIASGRVIVTLDPSADASAVANRAIRQSNAEVRQVYQTAIRGFAATLSPAAAEVLARDPSVRSITPDYPVQAAAQTLPTSIDRIDADKNATAAIDGVDTRVNVDIAILDSGISAHSDLNVVGGVDCTGTTGTYADDDGHGTHVAGTAGAKDNGFGVVGAAPGARLYGVKVLDATGNGNYSTLICGIDWVTARAGTIDVANLSLSGKVPASSCDSDPFHKAICNSVAAGVTYTVAAGNSSANASDYVPASFDEVITVSALNDKDGTPAGDSFASFSNFGSAVDIAAPGSQIYSTLPGNSYGSLSGTSVASPHVAGAAGLVVASRGRIGPAAVKSALQSMKQNVALSGDPDGIDEGVLYVGGGFSSSPTPTPTSPPSTNGNLRIVSAMRSGNSTLPTYAYDNNASTSWYTYSSTPPSAAFITFDLGQVQSISSVEYEFRLAGYADRYYIQFSGDGIRYSTLGVRANPPAQQTQTLNVSTSARYVRFYFVNPNNDARLGFLAEVDFFGTSGASASDVSTAVDAASTPPPTAEDDRSLRGRATSTTVPVEGSATPAVGALRGTATTTPPTQATREATSEADRTLRERATGTPVATLTPSPEGTATVPPPGEAPPNGTAQVVNTRGAGANCRVGPSGDAAVIAVVPEGSVVTLNGARQGDWQPVLCDGQMGFISASLLDTGNTEPSREVRGSTPVVTVTAGTTRPIDEGAGESSLAASSAVATVEPTELAPTEPPASIPTDTATPTTTPSGPTPLSIVASRWSDNSAPATAAYDDDFQTAWQTITGVPEPEAAAVFDLGAIQAIGSIRWVLAYEGMADALTIQVSEDGESWMTVAQPRNVVIGEWQTTPVDVAARYVRFLFENPTYVSYLGGLAELDVLPALGVVQPVVPDPVTPTPAPEVAVDPPGTRAEMGPGADPQMVTAIPVIEESIPGATDPRPAIEPTPTGVCGNPYLRQRRKTR